MIFLHDLDIFHYNLKNFALIQNYSSQFKKNLFIFHENFFWALKYSLNDLTISVNILVIFLE